MIVDVGDEPRCNRNMRDLLIQRVAIVGGISEAAGVACSERTKT